MTKNPCMLLCAVAALACGAAPGTGEAEPGEGNNAPSLASRSEPRRPAPAFEVAKLGGGQVALAELAGKVVVIDFWATWCAPCVDTVPVLNAFFDAHREDGDVAVFGVSVDDAGEEIVAEWVAEQSVRYPTLLSDIDLSQRYGAIGFPATFIIAPDGSIEDLHVGSLDLAELEASLAAARAYQAALDRAKTRGPS